MRPMSTFRTMSQCILCAFPITSAAFVHHQSPHPLQRRATGLVLQLLPLPQGARGRGRIRPIRLSPDEEQGIADMRRMLEASWNVETMGSVPTNADSAADAAATAVINASRRKAQSSGALSNLFFVDLLLPQYDIRQGSNLYDEVLAVEFCVALSQRLKGRSTILVRDDKTVQTVSRVLDARERDRIAARTNNLSDNESDDVDEDEDEDNMEEPELYADSGGIGVESADVESFRNQLMSGWNKELSKDDNAMPSERSTNMETNASRRYRLASMLGSAAISTGADMVDDVIRAVSANAQPKGDEDTLIILSAASREELIGVRGLVAKYGSTKTILLVNCNLVPPPRELIKAQTVYSMQPFIARPKVSEGNLFGSNTPSASPDRQAPKVVLMRRFPRDWEIFVDTGSGFELARTAPATQVDRRGPSMEFIAGCVKAFMQSRLG